MDRLLWPAGQQARTLACLARVRSANRWPVGHGEEVHRLACFNVDEHGAVDPALPLR